MNRDWITNLAKIVTTTDSLKRSEWNKIIESMVSQKIWNICQTLFDESQNLVDVFNFYAPKQLQVKVFRPNIKDQSSGFLLMFAGYRVKINFLLDSYTLFVEYEKISGYGVELIQNQSFKPKVDGYGAVLWVSDEQFLMDSDYLMQYIFHRLIVCSRINEK